MNGWRTAGKCLIGLMVIAAAPAAVKGAAPMVQVQKQAQAAPDTPEKLFETTQVWSVHLTFTPEQWAALEPTNVGRPQRGRFQRGPEASGNVLAPVFMKEGDQDRDGHLSRQEFAALGDKWFAQWDVQKVGKLSMGQLRDGLDHVIPPEPVGFGRRINLLGPEGGRNGLAAANGIKFEYVHADLEFAGKVLKDVAVRYKGNGTWMQSRGSLKRSLKIDLNKYVKGQELAGVKKINLHNNVTDPGWMNEVMSYRLYRDAGVPASRSAYARVYVTVAGKYDHKYLGLYSIIEDVDESFAKERFDSKKGAIFKPVTPEPFTDLGDDWEAYQQIYDPKTDLTEKQKRRVIEFCRLVSYASDQEFAAKLGDYVDLDEFARYMAGTVYLSTLDSILCLGQNYYVYLNHKTGKLEFIPWDLDHSFGHFPMIGSQEDRENLSINRPWRGEVRLLDRIFKVEAFKKIYLAHMRQFSETIFKPERFKDQVDQTAAAIRSAVKEESADKLEKFDRVVAGQSPDGGVSGFIQLLIVGVKPIKGFVIMRSRSIADQLAGKSPGATLDNPTALARRRGGAFGPAGVVAPGVMMALDADKDGQITKEEFTQGFARWFDAWDTGKSGQLTLEQLREGLNRDVTTGRANFGGQRGRGENPGVMDRRRGRRGL